MDADIIFMPEVEQDLDEAYVWDEERREGVGDDFLNRVNACIQEIRRSPEMRTLLYKHYRRSLVRKFPYAVYYRYFEGTVTVYGVLHTSLNPRKWRRRLP